MNDWPFLVVAILALAVIVLFWAAARGSASPRRSVPPPGEPFKRSDVDVRRGGG